MTNNKMTEDEAKTKWCRYARSGGESATYNRHYYTSTDPIPAECKCVGLECMHFDFINEYNNMKYYRCRT